ncbi:hypothetical protein QBC45DRAFT_53633 [Copromyces sp. CBS 386.78]|nr:hypothetical protein QBC45DRAFT_53633 [Copromyces sp. CBS 386.78]
MMPSTTGAAKQVFAPILLPFLLFLTTFTPFVASHAFMENPVPYAAPKIGNGPIDDTNFPCQGGASATYQMPTTGYNIFPLGSKQALVLTGTAVHGGGSCQISITYDNPPTKDSKFRVIKSIEGGCIARGQVGNLQGTGDDTKDAVGANPDSYEYTIPEDIPTGNGTIAWTWFNKVGNREMYMACGPVQITGTDKPNAKETFDKLPEIFQANIGNQCTTPDNTDVLFPNPGKYVEKLNGATTAFASPTGIGCQKPTEGGAGAAATTTTAAAAGGAGGEGGGACAVTTSEPAAGAASVTTASAVGGNTVSTAPGAWITVPSTGPGASLSVSIATAMPSASAPVSVSSAPPASSSVSACLPPTDAATSPSVLPTSAAATETAAAPSVSNTAVPPSTLVTSTIPTAAGASSPLAIASTSGQKPESIPPSGRCPPDQDGWYVCRLDSNSMYGKAYHRCASGQWTGMMAVPPGLFCTMADTAAGNSGNAAARSKPEKELTLEVDEPLVINPIDKKRTAMAGAGTATVTPNTAAGPEATSTVSTGGVVAHAHAADADKRAAADDPQDEDQDQDYLPDYDDYEEESSSITKERSLKDDLEKIGSTKLNIPRGSRVVSPSPSRLEARRRSKYHHNHGKHNKRQERERRWDAHRNTAQNA